MSKTGIARYFIDHTCNDLEQVVIHAGPNVQLSDSRDASGSNSNPVDSRTNSLDHNIVPPIILHSQIPELYRSNNSIPNMSLNDRSRSVDLTPKYNYRQPNIIFRTVKNENNKPILTPSIKYDTEEERQFEISLEEHKNDYLNKAAKAKRTGACLKYGYVLFMCIIIMISALIMLLSTIAGIIQSSALTFTCAVLAAISAILTGIVTLLQPSKRAVVINQAAVQLRILANDLTWLTFKNLTISKKIHILIDIDEKANEAKTDIFDMDITNFRPPQQKSIVDGYKDDTNNSKTESNISEKVKNYFKHKDEKNNKNKDEKKKDEIEIQKQMDNSIVHTDTNDDVDG